MFGIMAVVVALGTPESVGVSWPVVAGDDAPAKVRGGVAPLDVSSPVLMVELDFENFLFGQSAEVWPTWLHLRQVFPR